MVALDLNFPDAVLVSLNLKCPEVRDVYRIDLKTGALSLDTANPGNALGWQVDRHLRVRAVEVRAVDRGRDVRVRDTVGSPWRTVEHWGVDEHVNCTVAGFSADEQRLYLLSSRDADTLRLVELDLASGSRRVLAADSRYDASAWPQFSPRTGTLEAVQFVGGRTVWKALDACVRDDFASLRKICDGDFDVVSRDLADRLWLVNYTRDDAPHSLYVYDRTTRRAQRLWNDNPTLARYRLAKIRPIAFRSRDGLEIQGYLTLPVGVETKNLPAVIYIHGGPWARHAWARQDKNMIQFLANRGYAVLQVNYRGSAGYGKRFLNAGDREAGAKMLNDVIDVKRWAVDQGYIDPKRVCIMGPSFGGYLSLAGVSFEPDEFACAVDLFGPSNLITLIRSSAELAEGQHRHALRQLPRRQIIEKGQPRRIRRAELRECPLTSPRIRGSWKTGWGWTPSRCWEETSNCCRCSARDPSISEEEKSAVIPTLTSAGVPKYEPAYRVICQAYWT
jgi:dipeptidyl aminopeptidase/acylaminoacyl peptidase